MSASSSAAAACATCSSAGLISASVWPRCTLPRSCRPPFPGSTCAVACVCPRPCPSPVLLPFRAYSHCPAPCPLCRAIPRWPGQIAPSSVPSAASSLCAPCSPSLRLASATARLLVSRLFSAALPVPPPMPPASLRRVTCPPSPPRRVCVGPLPAHHAPVVVSLSQSGPGQQQPGPGPLSPPAPPSGVALYRRARTVVSPQKRDNGYTRMQSSKKSKIEV